MTEDVRRAFEFMGRADIAGERRDPFRFGTAVFDDELALRHDSNYLLVERAPADAGQLVARLGFDEAGRYFKFIPPG